MPAVSHPTSRAIIGQLADGPARILDIAAPFDTALNSVTEHLKMLERAGLIERKKQGREVLISLSGEPLREVAAWVHLYEQFWVERIDEFEQHFKDKKTKVEEVMKSPASSLEFTLERNIPAAPSEVFDGWIDPKTPGTPWNAADKVLLNPK